MMDINHWSNINREILLDDMPCVHFSDKTVPLVLEKKDSFFRLLINNSIIFETKDMSLIDDIKSFAHDYKTDYKQIKDRLLESIGKNIPVDDEYFIEIKKFNAPGQFKEPTAILYKKGIPDAIAVGQRTIEYSSLMNSWLYERPSIAGHTDIYRDFRRQGCGLKLYQALDKAMGVDSIPFDDLGMNGYVSEGAKRLWNKINKGDKQIAPHISEKIDRFKGVMQYLSTYNNPDIIYNHSEMDNIFIHNNYDEVLLKISESIRFLGFSETETEEYIKSYFSTEASEISTDVIAYYLETYHGIEKSKDEIEQAYKDISLLALSEHSKQSISLHKTHSLPSDFG